MDQQGARARGLRRSPSPAPRSRSRYFRAPDLEKFSPERFPIWIWHGGPDDSFYGLPVYGAPGTKVGQDVGGDTVTVDTRTFETNERILANLRGVSWSATYRTPMGPELLTKTCLYDMPPDRDFVLGTVPDHPQISVFNGAGHASSSRA